MFKLIVLFSFIGVAFSDEAETLSTKLALITRNAIFQVRFSNVAIQTQIVGCTNYELKSAKNDEEKSCVKNVKKVAIKDSTDIVSMTVGMLLVDLAHAKDDLNEGNVDKVKRFLDGLDYETYKVSAKKNFREAMKSFIVAIQEKMEKCKQT